MAERWWWPSPRRRWPLAIVTTLLAITLVAPLWTTRMEAPQYHGEEALEVWVYANRVEGDLKEIETLNQYVGVELPLGGKEMALAPWACGGLVALAAVATLLPSTWRRAGTLVLLATMVIVALLAVGILQLRLYQMGHDRGEQIMRGVEDFTPPLVGSIHVANFDARMAPASGGWAFVGALVLTAWTAIAGRRRRERPPASGNSERSPVAAHANRHERNRLSAALLMPVTVVPTAERRRR